MPRQRKAATATQSSNQNKEGIFKMALTAEQIKKIYAERRTKGLYIEKLTTFMESGEMGISVKEEWNTQFGEKKATTLKQGFENAKDSKAAPEGSELVDVIVDGDEVFLINRSHVEGELVGAEA